MQPDKKGAVRGGYRFYAGPFPEQQGSKSDFSGFPHQDLAIHSLRSGLNGLLL